ncbi:MAG: hypothetical protein ACHQVS_04060 [Candidatus Babeliales bacterium]
MIKFKFFFILILIFFSSTKVACYNDQNYSLVFVYLGDKLPNYLAHSIGQARLFNNNCAIYFIANESAIENHVSLINKLQDHKVIIVTSESLPKSNAHEIFDAAFLQRPEDFGLHGFLYWKFTTERFFYIHELMQKNDLKDVFQVECDVMLYVNIENYLTTLHTYYHGIACPFQNDNVASVSFTYFSNTDAIKKFTEFISYQLRGQHIDSDMHLLAAYKNCAPDEVNQLPTVTKEVVLYEPLKSLRGDIPSQSWKYWNHIEDWNSIFDNDNIGTFLEVKHWGAPRIIFNHDAYNFTWEKDSEQRWIPYICEKETHRKNKYRINTLHVAHKGTIAKYLSVGPMPLSI